MPNRPSLQLAHAPSIVGRDGATVALAPRDAALLAWLALEGPTTRSRLAALLWPESDVEAARNALRQRLFQLRRTLGFEAVVGSNTLELAADLAHDLGPATGLLGEAPPAAAGEFAEWLTRQRGRRRERLRDALVQQAQAAEDARDWHGAVALALELLATDPQSEAAHRRVMRLHYVAGDRVAALLAFDRCEQVLKDEVGARPSSETLALLETIEQANDGVASRDAARASGQVPAAMLRPPRLIGRDAEWRALHGAWDAGRHALVTGEGGMGKSRLVNDFAQARGRVLVVSARPGDERVVYASLSRLLRALPRQAVSALAAPLRSALAWLLPELGEPAPPSDADSARARFLNAVSAALDAEALAIDGFVIDDLHLADSASIEALQYAAAASSRRWIVTARLGDVTAPGRLWLDDWLSSTEVLPVPLAPLDLAQVREIIESLQIDAFRSEDDARTLLRRCGGNPLYLLETLKAALAGGAIESGGSFGLTLQRPVAGTLQVLIERRIGRLSPDAVRLARWAAVAAPDFSIEMASQVLGLRTLDLADPWAELEAAQVLRDGAFAHDLIYEAALASVPLPVARQLHAEIAACLQQQSGEPARLAQHWLRAGRWPEAAAAFLAASDRSRDASCLSEQCALLAEAARCFGLADRPMERFDALLDRARVLAANDFGDAATLAVEALEQAATTGDQRLLATDARLALTMTRYELHGSLEAGFEAVAEACALGRVDLALRFTIILSGALCDARRADEAVALLEPYGEVATAQSDVGQRWEYWEALGLALDYAGRLADAVPAWDAALAVAQAAGRHDMVWKTMSNRASSQAKMGLVLQASEAAEQAHRLARGSGDAVSMRVLQMQVTLAHRLRDVGRYAEALALLQEALGVYEARGASHSDQAAAEQHLVVLYRQLGQPARALHLLATERPGLPPGMAMIRLAHRAELETQTGRDGLALMREALRIISNADDIYHRITTMFATRLVPPDEGEALAADLACWATARGRHGVALAGHVRAAACALAVGAPERALPAAQSALQLFATYLPDSFYLAETWLVAAQVFAALGDATAAERTVADGQDWVRRVNGTLVPPEFRNSFMNRNEVNRALLAMPRTV